MHLRPDELIDLAEGGQIDGGAHLQSCAMCRAEVSALKAAMASAASVDVPDPSPLFWNHLSDRVRTGIASEGAINRDTGWSAWRPSWSAVALAGIAAAVALAIYVTVPRDRSPLAPATTPAETSAEAVLQPFGAEDDPSLTLVADLTGQLDPEAVNETGWTNHAAGVEGVVANLTNDERVELHRLLQEALEKRDAS